MRDAKEMCGQESPLTNGCGGSYNCQGMCGHLWEDTKKPGVKVWGEEKDLEESLMAAT